MNKENEKAILIDCIKNQKIDENGISCAIGIERLSESDKEIVEWEIQLQYKDDILKAIDKGSYTFERIDIIDSLNNLSVPFFSYINLGGNNDS